MPMLSKKIEKEARKAAEDWKFSSTEEFVKEAVEGRILELKERKFKERTDKVKEKLRKKGISDKQILGDFADNRNS